MKNILTIIIVLTSIIASAQDDLSDYQKQINKQANDMEDILMTKDYISDFEKINSIGFTLDTFKVEKMLELRLENEFTTMGMITTIQDAEEAYDKLLNKYYQILRNKLKEEDRNVLKQTQLNWIKFRDSENSLNSVISMPQYSGGGTMHNITVAFESMEIVKRRVLEIYNHISRFYEYDY